MSTIGSRSSAEQDFERALALGVGRGGEVVTAGSVGTPRRGRGAGPRVSLLVTVRHRAARRCTADTHYDPGRARRHRRRLRPERARRRGASSPGPACRSRSSRAPRPPAAGCRTAELTLPGFHHDVCSAVHPLLDRVAVLPRTSTSTRATCGSARRRCAFAHPLDGGRAAAVRSSVEATAEALGRDARRYRRLFGPSSATSTRSCPSVLAPLRVGALPPARHGPVRADRAPAGDPDRGAVLDRGGARRSSPAPAAHSMLSLVVPALRCPSDSCSSRSPTALGWPVVAGGSERDRRALCARSSSRWAAGSHTGIWVTRPRRPPRVQGGAARRLAPPVPGPGRRPAEPARAGGRLERFRYGPGVCKVDWALSGPVPWAAEVCREAGPCTSAGPSRRSPASEATVAAGRHAERPFVLVAQPGVVDPSRAPEGQHTLWGYCHVPPGLDGRHDRARSRPRSSGSRRGSRT